MTVSVAVIVDITILLSIQLKQNMVILVSVSADT